MRMAVGGVGNAPADMVVFGCRQLLLRMKQIGTEVLHAALLEQEMDEQ